MYAYQIQSTNLVYLTVNVTTLFQTSAAAPDTVHYWISRMINNINYSKHIRRSTRVLI